MVKPNKTAFKKTLRKIRNTLPEGYSEEDSPEEFNHVFRNLETQKSIGILWLKPKNSEDYYELDEYEFRELTNSEVFEDENELLEYIENNIN